MLPAVPAAAAVATLVAADGAPATAAGGVLVGGCLTAVRRGIDGGGMCAGPPMEVPATCFAAVCAAAVLTPVGSEDGTCGTVWLLLMILAAPA